MTGRLPACVIDVGTGYTKMGFAGDKDPKFVIPTIIAMNDSTSSCGNNDSDLGTDSIGEADCYIGDAAIDMNGYSVKYPVRHGCVEDWNLMEKFMDKCISQYLHADPENQDFLLTESPLNTSINRQHLGEIMYETFNVSGLYIGIQSIFALVSGWTTLPAEKRSLTGIVIESGDSVTRIVPITQGFVIGSCIQQMPFAGKDITSFVEDNLREREVGIPPEQTFEIAKTIKEKFCYTCPNMAKEFDKYEREPDTWIRQYDGFNAISNQRFAVDVGYERFMGPEIFFHPEFLNPDFTIPLSEVVNSVIQKSSIDLRRSMYQNILLSGGSTLFRDFGRRLQRDIQRSVNGRLRNFENLCNGRIIPQPIDVQVISNGTQRYGVWFGGSIFASADNFHERCYTKAAYNEYGPNLLYHQNQLLT